MYKLNCHVTCGWSQIVSVSSAPSQSHIDALNGLDLNVGGWHDIHNNIFNHLAFGYEVCIYKHMQVLFGCYCNLLTTAFLTAQNHLACRGLHTGKHLPKTNYESLCNKVSFFCRWAILSDSVRKSSLSTVGITFVFVGLYFVVGNRNLHPCFCKRQFWALHENSRTIASFSISNKLK